MKFLVVGCGSIGERHIRNLKNLSDGEIIACDINRERLSVIEKKYDILVSTDSRGVLNHKPDAVIICTPPNSHIPVALNAVKHSTHCFIEKPLSNNLDGVDELIKKAKEKNLILFVGYNLRFHPGLKLTKRMVGEGRIGKMLSAEVEFGQYLPDWRPWQDYRQSYTAKKDLGGGIILDGSHEIDYIRWLMGEIKEVSCFANKISNLKVETEDTAEILFKFESGAIAQLHLDFVQRVYSRSCKLIGERGTISWDYSGKFVKIYTIESKNWEIFNIEADPNDMYIEEMKHFIKCLLGEAKPPVDGRSGERVLEIALAARKSSIIGAVVGL